jgi:glycosyltransferase involved in cell wall biosynthesis
MIASPTLCRYFLNTQAPKILAIIPCYNEAGAIGELLREFQTIDFPCDTLVIDDGSSDDTQRIAQQYSKVLRMEKNQGIATAMRSGISYALEHGYDLCIQVDGDGQHIPSEIPKITRTLQTTRANITIGSRYAAHFPFQCKLRRIAGILLSFELELLFKKRLYDPLSGMRMMDRTAMQYFANHLRNDHLDAEIVPLALKQNLSITEIPVRMRLRMNGVSHLNGLSGVKFMLRLVYKISQHGRKTGK